MSEATIKIPSAAKQEQLALVIREDEAFRFPSVKVQRDKPRFEIPAPLPDDKENVETVPTIRCVMLLVKKNTYQSQEDKDAGKEPKEKRECYILREGRIVPERFFLNPTSVRNWQAFLAPIAKREGGHYAHVLVELSAEKVSNKQYTWMKINIKEVRSLTEDEQAYIDTLREVVNDRVKTYQDAAELASLEDEFFQAESGTPPVEKAVEHDDVEAQKAAAKETASSLEDDDTDAPVAEKPAATAKPPKETKPKVEKPAEELAPGKPAEPELAASGDDDLDDLLNAGGGGTTPGKTVAADLEDDD